MTGLEAFGRLPAEIEVLDPELWEAPVRLGGDDDCDPGGSGPRRTTGPHDNPQEDDQ